MAINNNAFYPIITASISLFININNRIVLMETIEIVTMTLLSHTDLPLLRDSVNQNIAETKAQ